MAENKITINGQEYDSPEAMPPDVRRMYDAAMRTMSASLASGQSGESTQVFTGRAGDHIGASMVVNRVVTVNKRTFGSAGELPPDVRQQYEDALKAADPQATHPKFSLHVSVNVGKTGGGTLGDPSGMSPTPLPIEDSSTESKIRGLPMSLAILVVIGLVLWALLGRQ
jgi:hypothetical protein